MELTHAKWTFLGTFLVAWTDDAHDAAQPHAQPAVTFALTMRATRRVAAHEVGGLRTG